MVTKTVILTYDVYIKRISLLRFGSKTAFTQHYFLRFLKFHFMNEGKWDGMN